MYLPYCITVSCCVTLTAQELDSEQLVEGAITLFLFRWAEAECMRQGCGSGGRQQRSVLGQALKLIRFPLMTVEEFAQGPAQSNILTDAEVVQLFLYFSVSPIGFWILFYDCSDMNIT